jgi:Zn-dependent protease with chaperone function
MADQLFGPGAIRAAALIALLPALLRWWWGRPLQRLGDDPLIAERLLALNTRLNVVSVGCMAALIVLWPRWILVTIPLQTAADWSAAYPLRKTLYQETWSLGSFLGFFARLTGAAFGFWILLATAPWITSVAGRFDWFAAAALAVALFAWDRYYPEVLRAALRAQPIVDPELLDRFDALAARSTVAAPRFDYVPMRGGVLANAVAVASLRGWSVIFTDTLLSRLTLDETVAICGHELAHLEYFDRARLRRLRTVNWLLIAGAAAVTPVSRRVLGTPDIGLALLLWPVVVVTALAIRAKHRQRNETASDLRAVALTGDAEALASALTTLHAVARVPRRWDRRKEQQATHPSLARRIRDIRAAAGMASVPLASAAAFESAAGNTVVTFDEAHLRWQEGLGTTSLLDYASLTELRLDAPPSGAISLVAVQQNGRRWQMTPRPGDVAALQSMLDSVDGRLTHVPATTAVNGGVARLVAIAGWLLAFVVGQFALAFVAILATFAPAAALFNASGGAALVAAAVVLRDGTGRGGSALAAACMLAGLGACFLAMGHVRRRETAPATSPLIGILALFAGLSVAALAIGGFDAVRLHQAAHALPAAAVWLVALALACWTARSRSSRYVALTAALAGVSTVTLGSTTFLDSVATDPFLVSAPYVKTMRIEGHETADFTLPFDISALRLSPNGRLTAVVRGDPDDEPRARASVFQVRRSDGSLFPVQAADISFMDDRRALVLVLDEGGADVRAMTLEGAPAVTWHAHVAGAQSGSLAYDAGSNRWTLLGRGEDGRIVRATGVVGAQHVDTSWWSLPQRADGWIEAVGVRNGTALLVEKRYDYGALGPMLPLVVTMGLTRTYAQSRLLRVGDAPGTGEAERSRLDASCRAQVLDDDSIVCTAFDGTRTHVVAMAPETGAVRGLAMLDGEFHGDQTIARGWLTGWLGYGAVAIRLETREALRPRLNRGEYIGIIAPAAAVIGTAASVEEGTRVRLYPLCAQGRPAPCGR